MTNKWILTLGSWSAIAGIALLGPIAASADCASTTSNAQTNASAYSAYAPEYYSGYSSLPYGEAAGCSTFGSGQWIWNGSSWVWCSPSAAYAPSPYALSGYYGTPYYTQPTSLTGSPFFDLALGLTAASLLQPSLYQAPYGYYPSAYAQPISTAAAFYPGTYAGGSVVNVTHVRRVTAVHRIVRIVRHRPIITPIRRDRIAMQHRRIEANRDRLATQRSRIVERPFAHPRRMAAPRAFAPPRANVARAGGGRQRPPR